MTKNMKEAISNDINGEARPTTLRDLLATVFRHRRLVALSFLGVLSGAILVAVFGPNRYQAEMKILVKRERVDPVVTSEASPLTPYATAVTEEELNSEVELLRSRDLLEKVVLACELQRPNSKRAAALSAVRLQEAPNSDNGGQVARAVSALANTLKVEVLRKTNFIALHYQSPDPQLSARVLNALAEVYLEKHVSVHRPTGAVDFFQKATERYRQGLADAETQLVDFQRNGAVVSAQLEKAVALQKFGEFDATLKQTQAAIAETEGRIRTLQAQQNSFPSRVITQVRASDNGQLLAQLRSNLLTLELKRTELLMKFEPSYRPVQEVEAQIAEVRAALTTAEKSPLRDETTDRDLTFERVRDELAKAKAELAGLQARAEATAAAARTYRENARSLDQKEIVQGDLIRTVKATEESYLLYRRKEEEARISDALDRRKILNVVIAEPATAPLLPSNHRSSTVLIGLLLATLASLGLAFTVEYLNPTFRTPDEVMSFLSIPVLAALPRNGKEGKDGANRKNSGNGVGTHVC